LKSYGNIALSLSPSMVTFAWTTLSQTTAVSVRRSLMIDLGIFLSREAAERHEREVQYFKRR
jgi:hypothetical protein